LIGTAAGGLTAKKQKAKRGRATINIFYIKTRDIARGKGISSQKAQLF
jgi:hypothetical protein